MIIAGNPQLGLQQHQQDAYEAVQKSFENGNKASVVIPTGCGKSFISLQLMEDNRDKNMLFLAPTNAIKNQMYNYIAKYIVGEEPSYGRSAIRIAEEHFPNLKIMLYPSLLRAKDDVMEKMNLDVIIMDELHRTGADQWGPKVDNLLELNPRAKVLGVTATPDRADDINVIDKLFEGNTSYELTLVEAIQRGIVNPPSYVKCDYNLGGELEGLQEEIRECQDEKLKKELEEKLHRLEQIVEQADGINELFAKNLPDKKGKYIVFCKDKEHMDLMMEEAKSWFAGIDDNPEMSYVYSGKDKDEKTDEEVIKEFEESKSEHIKLLFSINKLNEGLHVEDIAGVIMLRPTESRIMYLQQLGRALSSDTSRQKTIIFDLVNNYLKNNLDAEINEGKQTREINEREELIGEREDDFEEKDYIEDIDIFRIQGETKEFLELLEEVNEILGRSNYLKNARDIEQWINESGDTKPPSSNSKDLDEKRLGMALSNIRQNVIKPYENLESEEERKAYKEKYPYFEEVYEIINRIDENNIHPYLRNAREVEQWINESGDVKPPNSNAKDSEEKRLGLSLHTIRMNVIKPYEKLESEEERKAYKEKYPYFEEIYEIVNRIDEKNIHPHLRNAREIEQWINESGDTKRPSSASKDIDEKRLGTALDTIKKNLIKEYEELESEEERNAYKEKYPYFEEVYEIVNRIDEKNINTYLKNAREIEQWINESGDVKPPSANSKDIEEKQLAQAWFSIKKYVIKPYEKLESEEERKAYKEKYPYFEEVYEIINRIDEKNINPYLRDARKIETWINESGDTKLPSRSSQNEEERTLAVRLKNIRGNVIKPYEKLQTEEERKAHKEKYPYCEEVYEIVNRIDEKCGKKKQTKLSVLVEENNETTHKLEEARKLERQYKEVCISKDNSKGVGHGE